jgi:signal transduction histidine kinase
VTLSLRRRLVVVLLLAAVACLGALVAVGWLARTSARSRVERAKDIVTREVERLRDVPDAEGAGGRRMRGRLFSGYLDVSMMDGRARGGGVPEWIRTAREEAARASAEARDVTVREFEHEGVGPLRRRMPVEGDVEASGKLVVAAVPLARGGYAWAATWVLQPRGEGVWRIGVLVLALAMVAMMAIALHTLSGLDRAARSLDRSLKELAKDLGAPVERPPVGELAAVADGIASLARALTEAEKERSRLTQELTRRERLASLGRVVAGVAHEVRNPLTSIKLQVDLARQALASGRVDHASLAGDLGEVGAEVSRLDRLVADLLVVSGRRTGVKVETDLRALLTQRAEQASSWAAERDVRCEAAGEGSALIDRDGVTRAVDNLLRNAVEASPRGARVEAIVRAVDDARVAITVTDAGEGVPEARVKELFEPFFTTKSEGTGLGLALSRAVAEAHGGSLVYRREGSRTVFEITLPRRGTDGDGAGG